MSLPTLVKVKTQKYVHSVSAPCPCISIPTSENCVNDANDSPTHFQFRSNLQPHSYEDGYHPCRVRRSTCNTHAHHAPQLGYSIDYISQTAPSRDQAHIFLPEQGSLFCSMSQSLQCRSFPGRYTVLIFRCELPTDHSFLGSQVSQI